MLRKFIHIIVWIFVIAYLCVALAFTGKREVSQRIDYINVDLVDSSDFKFITREEVIIKLNQHGIKIIGMNADSVNRSAVRDAVLNIPEVKDVNVFYTHKNELHIKVWQRKPVVRIKSGRMDFYLDEDNEPMPFSPGFSPRVLVVTGSVDFELAKNKLFDLARYIEQDDFLNALIQEINVNNKEQLEIVTRIGNHRIFMGEADNYEWKFTKLMAFYDKALPDLGWDRYSSIDIRFGDQVVCKRKNDNSI